MIKYDINYYLFVVLAIVSLITGITTALLIVFSVAVIYFLSEITKKLDE